MKTEHIPISKLQLNTGQIPGVPKNPRFCRDERFAALVKSIQDDPEMLELRECIVYPHEGAYVVIGGNMRLRACKELKHETIPCKVLKKDTPPEKLRAYLIKDNVAIGNTDFDLIANEWDAIEVADFGMEIPGFADTPDEADEPDNTGNFYINITCDSEQQAETLYERLTKEGLNVKIIT